MAVADRLNAYRALAFVLADNVQTRQVKHTRRDVYTLLLICEPISGLAAHRVTLIHVANYNWRRVLSGFWCCRRVFFSELDENGATLTGDARSRAAGTIAVACSFCCWQS